MSQTDRIPTLKVSLRLPGSLNHRSGGVWAAPSARAGALVQLLELSPGKILVQTSVSFSLPLPQEQGGVGSKYIMGVGLHGKCCGLLPLQLDSFM